MLPLPRRIAIRTLAGLAGAGLLALSGCSSDTPTAAPTSAAPTPIAQLRTGTMAIPRINFCELVPESAVDDALGTKKWLVRSSGNGDRASLSGPASTPTPNPATTAAPATDVLAEHLCSWMPPTGGVQARAWTFAPPVTRTLATQVVAEARTERGCRVTPGPRFGNPTLTQVCRTSDGVRVRHAGLFADTWFSCEVMDASADAAVVRARADEWCVQVAQTLDTTK